MITAITQGVTTVATSPGGQVATHVAKALAYGYAGYRASKSAREHFNGAAEGFDEVLDQVRQDVKSKITDSEQDVA